MAPRKPESSVSETERVMAHFGRANSCSREDKSIHLAGHSVSRGVSHDYASPGARSSPAEMKVIHCSYGGKIIRRLVDGVLIYVGGGTRNIRVRKDVSLQELTQETFASMYDNETHVIKYLLPGEDLDALVAVSSDEDVQNMMDKWSEIGNRLGKFRMFLISTSNLDHDDARFGSVDIYSERFGRGYQIRSSEAHPIGYGKISKARFGFSRVDYVDPLQIELQYGYPNFEDIGRGIANFATRMVLLPLFRLATSIRWMRLFRVALLALLLCFLATAFFHRYSGDKI